jgi:hypothetical protein
MLPSCGDLTCSVSTGICGTITFGRGILDDNGYWEFPCRVCEAAAREAGMPMHEDDLLDAAPCKGAEG